MDEYFKRNHQHQGINTDHSKPISYNDLTDTPAAVTALTAYQYTGILAGNQTIANFAGSISKLALTGTGFTSNDFAVPYTGKYVLNLMVQWTAAISAGYLYIKNNLANIAQCPVYSYGTVYMWHLNKIVTMTAGDTINVYLYQTSGSSKIINSDATRTYLDILGLA